MTPPGDPLSFYEDNPEYTGALAYYAEKGFAALGFEVTELIRNARPGDPQRLIRSGEVRRLWIRKTPGGHLLRGMLAMLELKDKSGKTAVFQVLYTAANDARHLVRLTAGTFNKQDLESFRQDYDGSAEKEA